MTLPSIPPRTILVPLAIAAVAFVGSCTPVPPPDLRAQDEAAIRETDRAWSAAAKAKDLEKLLAFYASDAVAMAPNVAVAASAETRRRMWSERLARPGLEISWAPTKIEAARSGELGYSMGSYSLAMTGPDGIPQTDHGKYVTVWRKQGDGSWKVAVDIFNSDVAVPPPPPARKK